MPNTNTLVMVEFKDLVPHEDNIRYELRGIDELAKSIDNAGLQTPLRVRATPGSKKYTILAGHRRHAALLQLGTKGNALIPVMVTTCNGENDFVTMLVENLQREGIDAMEEATGIARLIGYGVKQADIAARLGVSPTYVSARVQLAKLPDELHHLVRNAVITLEMAVDLAKVVDEMPPEVVEIMAGYVSRSDGFRVATAVANVNREKLLAKGVKIATKQGLTAHPVQADIEAPEGKAVVWAPAVATIDELDDDVTDVVILAGPTGQPLYRPLLFDKALGTHKDPDAAYRAANRALKADHLEFWQGVLGSRPKKADVITSVIDYVVASAGINELRIASKILNLDQIKTEDFDGKPTTNWRLTWAQALQSNQTTALLALIAGHVEVSASPRFDSEWGKAIREQWGYGDE